MKTPCEECPFRKNSLPGWLGPYKDAQELLNIINGEIHFMCHMTLGKDEEETEILPAVLRLTLKKKWFDMIAAGIKKEEYRECKPYWFNRLIEGAPCEPKMKHFDYVEFRNGYKKYAPLLLVECNGITIGDAVPEWSDNWQGRCFVIRLGKIVLSRA